MYIYKDVDRVSTRSELENNTKSGQTDIIIANK